ncbi:MAG: site-specific integrase [Acidimicrobiales bacterium]|jgi:integrase
MAENVGRRGESWFFRVDLPPGPDGKRRQKRVGGFATEREARRALAQSKVDIDTGRLRYGARRTVAELAAEWLEAVRPNRKASTFSNYGWLMRAYVVPRIGPARLDRLTPADVQKLYSDLRSSGGQGGKPLSGTQVHNIHGVLHNALSYAVRMGYMARNPSEAIDKPRQDTEERPVYTPDQVRSFLLAAESDRLRALWHLVLATGLRRAELAGLRWRDVALDRAPPVLAVRTTRTTAGHAVVEHDPKTKSSRRVVHLDSGTVDILRHHHEAMAVEAEKRGELTVSEYVFVDEFGDPYHPAQLTRDLHSLQHRAGLPEITLHDLRHTAATVALLAGVHPKVVSERHGHASTQITLDRYSHVIESMQTAAADAIGQFLTS